MSKLGQNFERNLYNWKGTKAVKSIKFVLKEVQCPTTTDGSSFSRVAWGVSWLVGTWVDSSVILKRKEVLNFKSCSLHFVVFGFSILNILPFHQALWALYISKIPSENSKKDLEEGTLWIIRALCHRIMKRWKTWLGIITQLWLYIFGGRLWC